MQPNGDDPSLIPKELSKRFDRLEEMFARIATDVPGLQTHPKVTGLARRLERIRSRMEQPRIRLALLGQARSAKATILNCVLGAASDDGPALVGASTASMGTTWRFHKKTPLQRRQCPDQRHLCFLKFLTPEGYRGRRQSFCRYMGLDPVHPDMAIQAKIASLRGHDHIASSEPAEELETGSKDYEILTSLIDSFQRFGAQYVRDPARVEVCDDGSRADFVFRTGEKRPSPCALLDEVEIACDTEYLPDGLELIETPGLDILLNLEDPVALALLADFDGALVFQNAEKLGMGNTRELLRRLAGTSSSMIDRVFLVVTHLDMVKDAVESDGEKQDRGFLAELESFLREIRIPPARTVFVANGTLPDRGVRSEQLERRPAFRRPVEEVLRDGGASSTRAAIGELAGRAATQVREDLAIALLGITEELAGQIRLAADLAGFEAESFYRAVRWRVSLQQIGAEWADHQARLERPARDLINRLKKVFDQLCPPTLQIRHDRLPLAHKDYVHVLALEVGRLASETVLRTVFDQITTLLQKIESEVGKVGVKGYASPLDYWCALREKDLADRAWYLNEFKTFNERGFLDDTAIRLSVQNYRDLLQNKIAVTVHQATHALGRRLSCHLTGIGDDLAWLGDAEGLVGTRDRGALERLHDELTRSLP
jgi:hypothetical protein